jgi:hypothetical protein
MGNTNMLRSLSVYRRQVSRGFGRDLLPHTSAATDGNLVLVSEAVGFHSVFG